MIVAEGRHLDFRPSIHDGILHLIRDDADAILNDDAQTLGVEVGESEMANPALMLKNSEVLERVEIAIVGIVPPMELE